jgi:hypothetical protein
MCCAGDIPIFQAKPPLTCGRWLQKHCMTCISIRPSVGAVCHGVTLKHTKQDRNSLGEYEQSHVFVPWLHRGPWSWIPCWLGTSMRVQCTMLHQRGFFQGMKPRFLDCSQLAVQFPRYRREERIFCFGDSYLMRCVDENDSYAEIF